MLSIHRFPKSGESFHVTVPEKNQSASEHPGLCDSPGARAVFIGVSARAGLAINLLIKIAAEIMKAHVEAASLDSEAYPVPQPGTVFGEWRGAETILLAEDETFVRRAAGEALEAAGYNVLIAANAAEALEIYEENSEAIELLLTDVIMPYMGGHELAAKILARSPHARVLLMSGYEEQLIRCEQSNGEVAYLAKPFSVTTLLQQVRQTLDKSLTLCGQPAKPH